ncbi:MAG: tRNA (adenosine(37)-N6)-threonylcarbamoyltransferase complex ATPase subunit type 1 TsaE [Clostridia bacterium]|nr:tRNA (adenosine(37)-N6)-threonylcarbamoyltransferase complex ATPase subunit type 1 TsaE [Clostridia bacterium]
MKKIISNSSEETINLAEKIAPSLKTGDVIILVRRFRVWKN